MFWYFIILFILISASSNSAQESSACGNWTAFKDEKCYQLFKHVASYSDALNFCNQQDKDSTLPIIKTQAEQDAIIKILKASDVADNVWIGLTKINGVFKNTDQTDIDYSNWMEKRPLVNKTGMDCVEMSTDETSYGKWIDEKCQKQNAIICQKVQPWSIDRLQNTLLDVKRDFEKEKLKTLHLQQNPVPIGFIYVQLLGQNDPKNLWPNTEWQNISPKLAGLFFRVEGGQASEFGAIQDQQTQSFIVRSNNLNVNKDIFDKDVRIGTEYCQIYSGGYGVGSVYHYFKHDTEEIRPRNAAIRVWQRIK